MNLGQYINKLLFENDTVIIPGFGALVSKYKPAEINSETGEITPPSKEIFFHRQIRHEDGLLSGYIAENESLSQIDALKIIEKECENIIYRLDKGEKVLLEEVGEFFLNEINEIQFEPHFKENLLIDSFGLEPVNIFEENTELEPIITLIPETKKKARRLWYLLLLIPLAAIAFFVLSNNQDKVKVKEQENNQNSEIPEDTANIISIIDSIQVLPSDSIIDTMQVLSSDSTINSTQPLAIDSLEVTEYELNTTEPIINIDTTKFYLVGGSFKEEKNAEKYIEQFNIEGYEPFYIGKTGSFHLVGLGRYNTEQEANKAKKDFIEKKPYSGVWVYEKK